MRNARNERDRSLAPRAINPDIEIQQSYGPRPIAGCQTRSAHEPNHPLDYLKRIGSAQLEMRAKTLKESDLADSAAHHPRRRAKTKSGYLTRTPDGQRLIWRCPPTPDAWRKPNLVTATEPQTGEHLRRHGTSHPGERGQTKSGY